MRSILPLYHFDLPPYRASILSPRAKPSSYPEPSPPPLAVRELPRRTAPLVALERRSRVSATQASRLSGGVKRMVEDYAEAMALLNEKLVHWDEAIARAEQKQKKQQQQQQQQQQQEAGGGGAATAILQQGQ